MQKKHVIFQLTFEPNWALLAVYQAKIKELEAAWRWTLPQLIEAIHDIWDHELTVDYFNKWIDSMPERIQQVIDRKGGRLVGNSGVDTTYFRTKAQSALLLATSRQAAQ